MLMKHVIHSNKNHIIVLDKITVAVMLTLLITAETNTLKKKIKIQRKLKLEKYKRADI